MHHVSRERIAALVVAVAAQLAIGAAASPAWGWPASCLLIAATLVVVRGLGHHRRAPHRAEDDAAHRIFLFGSPAGSDAEEGPGTATTAS
jgi:hypothetical protein